MATPQQPFELVLTGGPAPRQYTAFVPDSNGGRVVEHSFEWREDSTALAMDLGALAQAAISGTPPENNLHVSFGRQLFDTVFAGPVSDLWRLRLAEARPRRQALRLVLRIDPGTARPLLNLPWEYLHDGDDFLALNWRTPLSRLPWGLPSEALPALDEPLRMLVLIAAPLGLGQNQVLNTAREEDILLGALADARRAGRIEVDFSPNGALETLEAKLREFDPHILHFVGHGVFVDALDAGVLLMETPDGRERQVSNSEFAELIERRARSLRMVFLSACQSAVAPRNDGYADLAPRLLRAGVPAVVAMQFSVLNRSAMDFGGVFYKRLAEGDPLDVALVEARGMLARSGLNTVDFATPVLFTSDPDCLRVGATVRTAKPTAVLDLTGAAPAQHFVGRTAELRVLLTQLDPNAGAWRAAVIHGLGGMGKTVLAARLAERMASQLHGVKAVRMTPTTTARSLLEQISAFLLVNRARPGLDLPAVAELARSLNEALPLETTAAKLIEVLRAARLLLIFDNCEDVLAEGQAVSRAAGEGAPGASAPAGLDPDLAKLLRLLMEGVPGPSRFAFTSRVDFNPLEAGRHTDVLGHIALGEMHFRDAVYLMENLPPLDRLPVAAAPEVKPDSTPVPRALSMRDVYARLGGHPYTLNLFAEHARRASVEAVLADLSDVRKELLEFTLLAQAVEQLPARAAELLRRAGIYNEAVPAEGLAFLMGMAQDGAALGDEMPDVAAEIGALLDWGLLAQAPGDETYALHALVRDWARAQLPPDWRMALLRRAARYWRVAGRESTSLEPHLNARHYLFLAGDYEAADDIVQFAWEYLLRWGQIELLLRLLGESVRTLSGSRRAVPLGNLATVYRRLGDSASARKIYEQVLAEFEASGDRKNVAAVLHQLGILYQRQGEYALARERTEKSLAISQELGNCVGVAASLHQLGMLHQRQGEYSQARERYEQSLAIMQELGDRAGVAISLHQLGMLHQDQGEYARARERTEQSLAIAQELGDRASVARSLHQLGMLHQQKGEYTKARECFEQSLAIAQELGDRAGVAISLHQLGRLHELQGEYRKARERYEQSLAIKQGLGDRDGVARSLGQLGLLCEQEGDLEAAVGHMARALALFEQLGAPERQTAKHSLARLRDKMGGAAFTAA